MGKTVSAMSLQRTKQYEFETFVREHRRIVGKVCYLYAMDSDDFDDLYQEVLINLWRGFDGFEGRAKVSSWVYRVALNTCISYYRRNRRHTGRLPLTDLLGAVDEDSERGERLRELYALINRLDALEKALVMLWLDELPYEETPRSRGLRATTWLRSSTASS